MTQKQEFSFLIVFMACRVKLFKGGQCCFREIIFQSPQTIATNFMMGKGEHKFEWKLEVPEGMPPTCISKKIQVEWFIIAKGYVASIIHTHVHTYIHS